MGRFSWLGLAVLLIVAPASPSAATVATITTTAHLEDHQDQSVNAAFRAALKAAVAGATAMGLPWIRISRARVSDDSVAVQILATDENFESGTGDEAPDPDKESDADVPELTEGKM
jgi:hypothetical protein